MFKTIKALSYFIVFLLTFSCSGGKMDNSSSLLIDIEANIDKMHQINLSQYASSIKYVRLELKEDYPLKSIATSDFTENYILVSDMTECLLYDTEGNFLSRIGKKGRGPGEFPYVNAAFLGADKKIYLKSLYDLLEYNIDGSFVNKYTKTFLFGDNSYLSMFVPIEDSLLFGHVPNTTGRKLLKAVIVNKNGKIKHSSMNYILFNRDHEIDGPFEGFAHIYNFKSDFFYKELYNDTLFYITDQYNFIPRYVFNLGKYKEPISRRINFRLKNNMGDYIYLYFVFQTENYLFLDCNLGDRFTARRFTSLKITGLGEIWYNTRNVLGIFDKKTRSLVFCKPTSSDNFLFTSGLYNDIDCGPRFFPRNMVNDSTMVMWMTAKDLKDHIASNDFKNNNPKYPEKKKRLEELANSLTEFDNPVLMFVTFKSK